MWGGLGNDSVNLDGRGGTRDFRSSRPVLNSISAELCQRSWTVSPFRPDSGAARRMADSGGLGYGRACGCRQCRHFTRAANTRGSGRPADRVVGRVCCRRRVRRGICCRVVFGRGPGAVPLENSQRVWVALGGHETCPRPVPGGLAWRGTVAAARVACASVLPGRRPRRGVLSLRVYRAVELVSGPGSPRTGVHGGESWGIVLACCPCRRNYPWSLRARKIV